MEIRLFYISDFKCYLRNDILILETPMSDGDSKRSPNSSFLFLQSCSRKLDICTSVAGRRRVGGDKELVSQFSN